MPEKNQPQDGIRSTALSHQHHVVDCSPKTAWHWEFLHKLCLFNSRLIPEKDEG